MKSPKPPKEVWVRCTDDDEVGYAFTASELPSARLRELGTLFRYILAPAPKPKPRPALYWVIRFAAGKYDGAGRLLANSLRMAARHPSKEAARAWLTSEGFDAEVVRVVRKRSAA